jgi:hypothetical protein
MLKLPRKFFVILGCLSTANPEIFDVVLQKPYPICPTVASRPILGVKKYVTPRPAKRPML